MEIHEYGFATGCMTVPYTVHTAELAEHRDLLVSLWQRNLQDVNPGRFAWIYERNPYGAPIVLLLKHEDSQSFVGAMALFPRPVVYKGHAVRAYICGDMVVDNQHRSLGPAVSLLRAAVAHCDREDPCMLVSFPNGKSTPVTLRVGFTVLGDNCEFVRVIRTRTYLRRVCRIPALADVLSWPADALLRWRYEWWPGIGSRRYEYDVLNEFDARFETLWGTQAGDVAFAGVRDRAYLNWRVTDSPYGSHEVFALRAASDPGIRGYVAFHCGDRRADIVDVAGWASAADFRALLTLFSRCMRQRGMESISMSVAGSADVLSQLAPCGYFRRGVRNRAIVYASFGAETLTDAILGGTWYLTPADNDI